MDFDPIVNLVEGVKNWLIVSPSHDIRSTNQDVGRTVTLSSNPFDLGIKISDMRVRASHAFSRNPGGQQNVARHSRLAAQVATQIFL
jgi:hypothetical protein